MLKGGQSIFRIRRFGLVVGVVAAFALMAGCGSGGTKQKASSVKKLSEAKKPSDESTGPIKGIPTPTPQSIAEQTHAGSVLFPRGAAAQQPVALVNGKPITAAELERWYVVKLSGQHVADEDDYKTCIAALKKQAEKRTGEKIVGVAELMRMCTARFEEGHAVTALEAAIHTRWLSGEAAEEGIKVSDREVQQELAENEKAAGGRAKLEAYLKGIHQTMAEARAEVRLNKVADAIFKRIEAKSHAAAGAEVASYYAGHSQQFTLPAGRRVRIVRTTTAAAAAKVKRELLAGTSFAQMAKKLSAIGQPITAKNGEVAHLTPRTFQEPALDNAIFSAKLNRIYGPIKLTARHETIAPETNSGYFIFEVKEIVPAHEAPLAAVRASLAKQLTKQQKAQNLAAFVRAFRSRWKARTDCRPGYVLTRFCRQYKPKAGEQEADPYAL
jgi:foldase protein PrsA